ncbi:hypothetical protein V6N13_026888 [Hibiscus sabdariffa]
MMTAQQSPGQQQVIWGNKGPLRSSSRPLDTEETGKGSGLINWTGAEQPGASVVVDAYSSALASVNLDPLGLSGSYVSLTVADALQGDGTSGSRSSLPSKISCTCSPFWVVTAEPKSTQFTKDE